MIDLVGKNLGQYQVVEELGRGGMAIVYRAYQASLNRHVAIKVLPPQLAFDQEFVARFQREAIAAAGLHHPNIVIIHDVGGQDGFYYIVMEFLRGKTIGEILAKDGPMPLPRVVTLMRQIASALDHAQAQQLVHRDIKPSNIMVDEHDRVTLMDFGVARAGERGGLTRTGMIVGTPDYMSPEQAQGLDIDHRSDIYALGVVLYEMLTGQVPFNRNTPHAVLLAHIAETPPPVRTLLPNVPPAVEAVVQKVLAKKPEDRYQTAGDLARDLERAAAASADTRTREGAVSTAGAATGAAAAAAAAAAANGDDRTMRIEGLAGPTMPNVPPAQTLAGAAVAGSGAGTVVGSATPATDAPAEKDKQKEKPAVVPLPWAWIAAGVVLLLVLLVGGGIAMNGGFAGQPTATATLAPTIVAVATTVAPSATSAPTDTATPLPPTATDTPPPTTRVPKTNTPEPTSTSATETATVDSTPTPTATLTRAPTRTPCPVTVCTPVPTATQRATATPGVTAPAGSPPPPGALYDMETFGSWTRGNQANGTFSQSSEQAHTGSFSGKLAYSYAGGDDFVVFLRPSGSFRGEPNWIGVWVYGDGSGHFLNAWIKDAGGQTWQVPLGRVYHTGWRQMSGRIQVGQAWPWSSIEGPDNAIVDYPISFRGFVYDPESPATSTIYLDDVSVGTVNTPPPTATSPVPPTAIQPTTPPFNGYGPVILNSPGPGTVYRGGQGEQIVLAWNAQNLQPGDCYILKIPHTTGTFEQCTYGTTFLVPSWLYDNRNEFRQFIWTVSIFSGSNNAVIPGTESADWDFYWFGG